MEPSNLDGSFVLSPATALSKTLLPVERPLSYSGGTSYPAHRLQAGSRHQEWTGGGWAFPFYKHTLLVNWWALNRIMSWSPLISRRLSLFQPQPASLVYLVQVGRRLAYNTQPHCGVPSFHGLWEVKKGDGERLRLRGWVDRWTRTETQRKIHKDIKS